MTSWVQNQVVVRHLGQEECIMTSVYKLIHWDVGKVSSADLPPQTAVALKTSRVWTQQVWELSVRVIENE